MPDPFAELFRALRVKSAVYFAHDFSPPWGIRIPPRPHAQFHVSLVGGCRIQSGNGTLLLQARDVVLFPTGAAHVVRCQSDDNGHLLDGRDVVQAIRAGEQPFPGVADCRLLSGHFECDRAARHPLLDGLPEMIHAAAADLDPALFDALYPVLSSEAGSRLPGAETIVERLVEIFLVQILRTHVMQANSQPGLLAALFDPQLGAAIELMHTHWHERLGLQDLARAAGMSRSIFAERFKETARVPPISYLARWRLLKAREMLMEGRLSVAQVAAACGHMSTEGFSRAFKRVYGESPTALRAQSGSKGLPALGGV